MTAGPSETILSESDHLLRSYWIRLFESALNAGASLKLDASVLPKFVVNVTVTLTADDEVQSNISSATALADSAHSTAFW